MSIPLVTVASHENQEITLLEHAQMAMALIPQLQETNVLLAKHRGTANMLLNGDATAEKRLQVLETQLQVNFVLTQHECQHLSTLFPLSCEKLTQAYSRWLELKHHYRHYAIARSSFTEHTALIAAIHIFQTDVADISSLNLSSSLATHYLMNNMVRTLPDLIESLGQLRGFGSGLAAHRQISQAERLELTRLTLAVHIFTENIIFELDKVFTSLPQFKNTLQLHLTNTETLVAHLLEITNNHLINSRVIQIADHSYFALATSVIDQVNQLYLPVVAELNNQLEQRIALLKLRRNVILAGFLGLLLFTITFISRLMRRINEPLKKAMACFEQISAGNYNQPIEIKYHDEIGRLLISLDKMRLRLADYVEQLQQAVKNLAEAQRIAHLGNWQWQRGQNSLIWSSEVYRIFEVDKANFQPSYPAFLERLSPSDRERVETEIGLAVKQPGNYYLDYAIQFADGREKIIHQHFESKFNSAGKIERMVGTVEDITERKQMEQKQLQAEKMAALGQLIAGIAHEINTPLGAINASANTMRKFLTQILTQLPELLRSLSNEDNATFLFVLQTALRNKPMFLTAKEQRRSRHALTRVLENNFDNAQYLADNLIDIGLHEQIAIVLPLLASVHGETLLELIYKLVQLQKGNQNIMLASERASKVVFALKTYADSNTAGKKTVIDIAEEIEVILTLYQSQIKQGIEVIKHYQQPLPPIYGFQDELNQVWTNLIHNALQAMNNHGILTITIKPTDGFLKISIQDNGVGIPPEILPKIFDAFFTTKVAGEGSGLGLHVLKNIIQRHAGNVEVESQVGCTVFHVLLPLSGLS